MSYIAALVTDVHTVETEIVLLLLAHLGMNARADGLPVMQLHLYVFLAAFRPQGAEA